MNMNSNLMTKNNTDLRKLRNLCLALLALVAVFAIAGASALADDAYPESAHPYSNGMNKTWTYTYPEDVDGIAVVFDEQTDFENNYDKLFVTDANGNTITYTGTQLKGATLFLPGNKFTLRMTTDGSVTRWGFAVTAVVVPEEGDNIYYTVDDSGLITSAKSDPGMWVTDVVIPDEYDGKTITGIANNAFLGDTWIRGKITIPDHIQSVGTGAFKNCSMITDVEFDYENRITSVPANLFEGCTSLQSVTLPYDADNIGSYAFNGCSSLTDLELPKGVKTINSYAFQNCTSLEDLELPAHITTISSYAFNGCTNLNTLDFPDTLTTIGDYAFQSCKAIESVELPSSVTSLGVYAFSGCSSIE